MCDNTNPNAYMHDDNQMHVGLFDDVGLLFDEGERELICHVSRVQTIIKIVRKNKPKWIMSKIFFFFF